MASPPTCAFAPCLEPAATPHRCCCRSHHLLWLASLTPPPVCRFPGCSRPAFLEFAPDHRPSRVHDFCGWTHCWEFALLSAESPLVDEKESWAEPSLDARIEMLKDFMRTKTIPPRAIQVDEHFFFKHPWEVLRPGDKLCWLIVPCRWKPNSNSKRELTTKEGFHWKQQSQPTNNDKTSTRYRTYVRMRSRSKQSDDSDDMKQSDDMKFTMIEYTVKDAALKDYCLVRLSRGESPSAEKQRQARKRARPDAADHPENSNYEQAGIFLPQLEDPLVEQEETFLPQQEYNIHERNCVHLGNFSPQLTEAERSLPLPEDPLDEQEDNFVPQQECNIHESQFSPQLTEAETWAASEMMDILKNMGLTEEIHMMTDNDDLSPACSETLWAM